MQGLLLSILLFTKKINHTANVVLTIAMLALSIDVFHSAYIIFEYYKEMPGFIGITYAFPFLYGPIFYLYAKLISSSSNDFKLKYHLHFIPFFIVVIYGIAFVYLKSSEFKFALLRGEVETPLVLELMNYLKPFYGIIYVFLTIRVVRDYNTRIRNSYSNIERINLNWLKHLTIGLSVIWGVVVISYVVHAVADKNIEMDGFIYMSASVLIYSIGYLSLRQPQIFDQVINKSEERPEPERKTKTAEITSYQKSGLADTEAKSHLDNLLRMMNTDKPYLNCDLTLRNLAEKLSVSPHNLSEILNTRINQNFYDFINRYRVEEVKRRLAENESQKYNLIAIAFDSGFNSKSAFNTIFKKHTGTTPSQYRKQLT
ncbi:MAG: AraC family transcriptional regulator [Ignavibacterium sp.]|nr:AraC family transcriptional regulator [Ignavibacterium sp.]